MSWCVHHFSPFLYLLFFQSFYHLTAGSKQLFRMAYCPPFLFFFSVLPFSCFIKSFPMHDHWYTSYCSNDCLGQQQFTHKTYASLSFAKYPAENEVAKPCTTMCAHFTLQYKRKCKQDSSHKNEPYAKSYTKTRFQRNIEKTCLKLFLSMEQQYACPSAYITKHWKRYPDQGIQMAPEHKLM